MFMIRSTLLFSSRELHAGRRWSRLRHDKRRRIQGCMSCRRRRFVDSTAVAMLPQENKNPRGSRPCGVRRGCGGPDNEREPCPDQTAASACPADDTIVGGVRCTPSQMEPDPKSLTSACKLVSECLMPAGPRVPGDERSGPGGG